MTIIYNKNKEISIYLDGGAFKNMVRDIEIGYGYIDGQKVDAAYAELLVTGEPDYIVHVTSADDIVDDGEYNYFDVIKKDRVLYIPDVRFIECALYQIFKEAKGWVDAVYSFMSGMDDFPELVGLSETK